MIPDLTVRTRLGVVDLVPFMRRDEGDKEVQLRDWEKGPAVIALDELGWHQERIAHATGLHGDAIRDVLEGREPEPEPKPQLSREEIRDRRMAERVNVDGRWVHPDAPHGKTSGYTHWGCRCPLCGGAQADYKAAAKARLDERRAAFA